MRTNKHNAPYKSVIIITIVADLLFKLHHRTNDQPDGWDLNGSPSPEGVLEGPSVLTVRPCFVVEAQGLLMGDDGVGLGGEFEPLRGLL